MNHTELGVKLKQCREDAGLSLYKTRIMSALNGGSQINEMALRKMERGETGISCKTMLRLIEIYGYKLEFMK